jgi:hypothetical protein
MQSLSIWMAALVYFGGRYRSRLAWGLLAGGVVIWALQDILISLRVDCWTHVWVDCFAVATMLPPLVWLWLIDRPGAAVFHDLHTTNHKAASS